MALPHAFMTSYPHAHITPGSTYAYTPTCPSVFTSTPPHAHTPTHRHPPRDEANSRVGATRNAMPFNGQETRKTKIERSRIYSEAIRLEQTRRAVCARVRSDLIPTRPHTKNPHQNNPMSGFYAYTPTCPSVFTSTLPHAHTPTHRRPREASPRLRHRSSHASPGGGSRYALRFSRCF
jgi:hypothetical protein